MAKHRVESEETAELVKQTFRYDPETGHLYRLKKVKGAKFGEPVGYANKNVRSGKTYILVRMNYGTYVAHRLIWVLVHGRWPGLNMDIDHEDGNGANNKLDNLREVTRVVNQKNQRRLSTNTSGCTGVTWVKRDRKWSARLYVGKRYIPCGNFDTYEEAVAARKAAEKEHGFHPNHGSDRPL